MRSEGSDLGCQSVSQCVCLRLFSHCRQRSGIRAIPTAPAQQALEKQTSDFAKTKAFEIEFHTSHARSLIPRSSTERLALSTTCEKLALSIGIHRVGPWLECQAMCCINALADGAEGLHFRYPRIVRGRIFSIPRLKSSRFIVILGIYLGFFLPCLPNSLAYS